MHFMTGNSDSFGMVNRWKHDGQARGASNSSFRVAMLGSITRSVMSGTLIFDSDEALGLWYNNIVFMCMRVGPLSSISRESIELKNEIFFNR